MKYGEKKESLSANEGCLVVKTQSAYLQDYQIRP